MRLGGTGCSCMRVSYRTRHYTYTLTRTCLFNAWKSIICHGQGDKKWIRRVRLIGLRICADISVARVCDHWIAVDYTCHIHVIQACTSCTRCVDCRAALWRKCNDIDRWFTKQWRVIRRRSGGFADRLVRSRTIWSPFERISIWNANLVNLFNSWRKTLQNINRRNENANAESFRVYEITGPSNWTKRRCVVLKRK